ncbi:hypothetical protein [Actinomadura luteofluorescens]|uniref:hypothetical protein n=1 Tax=Actinomadura luteofluorescens TaxID=46163 RepID=UPI003D92CB4F
MAENIQRFDNPSGNQDALAAVLKGAAEKSPTGQVDVQRGHNGDHSTMTTVDKSQSTAEIQEQLKRTRGGN